MVSLRRHFVPNPVLMHSTGSGTLRRRPLFIHTRYDNLNRVIGTEGYYDDDGDLLQTGSDVVVGQPEPFGDGRPDEDTLLWQAATDYDDLGRVYQTRRFDAATYDVGGLTYTVPGNCVASNTWYDEAGNVVKQQSSGQGFSKTAYDGLARTIAQYVGYDADEDDYAEVYDCTTTSSRPTAT